MHSANGLHRFPTFFNEFISHVGIATETNDASNGLFPHLWGILQTVCRWPYSLHLLPSHGCLLHSAVQLILQRTVTLLSRLFHSRASAPFVVLSSCCTLCGPARNWISTVECIFFPQRSNQHGAICSLVHLLALNWKLLFSSLSLLQPQYQFWHHCIFFKNDCCALSLCEFLTYFAASDRIWLGSL